MMEHEHFLQAILADPEADSPRLIYADWLEEQGDPRGEFIRLQCALAVLPADHPRHSELQGRERELYEHHAAVWAKPLTGKAARCAFRRGFIEAVTLTGK